MLAILLVLFVFISDTKTINMGFLNFFESLLMGLEDDLTSTMEDADSLGIFIRRVQTHCDDGKVEGALEFADDNLNMKGVPIRLTDCQFEFKEA